MEIASRNRQGERDMVDQLAFDVIVDGRLITLRGDLTDATDTYVKLSNALTHLCHEKPTKVSIDARQACLLKGGLKMWTSVVQDSLWQHEIDYAPSQLGMALCYYEAYRHPKSHFAEEDRNHLVDIESR